MKTELQYYDAAKAALAKAVKVGEVKEIRDKAIAMKHYGKIANDKELEAHAQAVRVRAERRLGEIMAEQKKTIGMNTGAKGVGKKVRDSEKPTLAEVGIGKSLAHRARQAAAIPEEKFEEQVEAEKARIKLPARKARAAGAKAAATRQKNRKEQERAKAERAKARAPFLDPWCSKVRELFFQAAADLKSHGYGTDDYLGQLYVAMKGALGDARSDDLFYDDEPKRVTGSEVIPDDERRAEMEKLAEAEVSS